MKVKLSIRKYINWVWIIERNMDIRKEYKKLSDIPLSFLPKFVFLDEEEFKEAAKICCSTNTEEGMDNLIKGNSIDIEWFDDFDYQIKLEKYNPNLNVIKEVRLMAEDINLNIIDLKEMEDKINKDIEDGSKALEKKIGVKIGIIQKFSFDPIPHMIVKIIKANEEEEDGKIWLEGPAESFLKGDYSEGKRVEIIAKNIGTIVGECDFGKIDNPLPLYVADYVRIMEFGIKEIKIGIIKKSSFDEDGIHAIVIIGNEEIFVEGSVGTFETGDYAEGTLVEITGKDFGTIVGEWEFGDLGILPLFNIESMKIINK